MTCEKRLTRGKDKLIAGVCSGIAEYFGLDVNLVRLGFILLALALPNVFIPFYILAAVILPDSENPSRTYDKNIVLLLTILLILIVASIYGTIVLLKTLCSFAFRL
jgi:phage shock protein PspC (stress-responsive transcriptional regulator)